MKKASGGAAARVSGMPRRTAEGVARRAPRAECLGLLCISAAMVCEVGCTIQAITNEGDGGEANQPDSSGGSSHEPGDDATTLQDAGSGADTGGGGGDASTGSAGEGGLLTGDPCGSTETANDDHDHATPITAGADFHACLQSRSDVDFYRLTTPSTPVQGGVFVVQINDVGMSGNIDLSVLGLTDDMQAIHDVSSYTMGQSQSVWFNAAAGTSYFVRVKPFSLASQTPYTLRIDFTGVPDVNEPNDDRTAATPIAVGAPVHGYLFSAPTTSDQATPWDDWYKVTLPAGSTTFALTDVASDLNAQLFIYDTGDGGAIANPYSYTDGVNVSTSRQLGAGDYYVLVQPFAGVGTSGSGTTPPMYTAKPYTFTVTQP